MNQQQILEEFVEASKQGQHRFWVDDFSNTDSLFDMPALPGVWRPKDLAQEFLEAGAKRRAEMRKMPTPRSSFKDPVMPELRGSKGLAKRPGCRLLSKEEMLQVKKLASTGVSLRSAASMYQVSRETIRRALLEVA